MRPALNSLPIVFALAVVAAVAAPGALHADTQSDALQQLSQPVTSDPTLGKLVGLWQGDGQLRRGSNREVEAVRCRLTNSWVSDGKLLSMQLACRGVDYRFGATTHLGRSGSTYRGAMQSTRGDRGILAGSGSSSRLNLSVTSTRPGNDGSTASVAMSFNSSQLTNTVQRVDPKTGAEYTALQVTLSH